LGDVRAERAQTFTKKQKIGLRIQNQETTSRQESFEYHRHPLQQPLILFAEKLQLTRFP